MSQAAENIVLHAEPRQDFGTSASRRMRRQQERVPAIVYGCKGATTAFSLEHKQMARLLQDKGILTKLLTLKIDAQEETVLLKKVQRHPYKKQYLHFDFIRVDVTKKTVVHCPIKIVGQESCPGIKAGGVISHTMNEVQIECLPKDLPTAIEVDISNLGNEQTLHVSDIKLPAQVSLAVPVDAEHDPAVLSIHTPKAQSTESDETTEESAESDAESKDADKPKD